MVSMNRIEYIDSGIDKVERDWNTSWFPDVAQIEFRLLGEEMYLQENQGNAENRTAYDNVCALRDRIDRSYTKKFVQMARSLDEKYIGLHLRIHHLLLPSFLLPSSLLPRSSSQKRNYTFLHFTPFAAAALISPFFSATCRYAVLSALADFFFSHVLVFRKLPKFQLDFHDLPYYIIGCPLIEELEFRGILQNSVTWLTGSSLAGIALSSALFGAVHHRGSSRKRMVLSALSSITYGILNHKFGLHAAFIAHATSNLIFSVIAPVTRP